jgi:nitroimidazol reductase NimA-like FMN-containing flavoprotein (pyridoxamine 5'-phosphate oxidase superfamily)
MDLRLRTAMLEKMKDFLKARDMCVLATCAEEKPHCSLMAYITDEAVTRVYLVTLKQTQKYRNFLKNPQVSLLVDTRSERPPMARAEVQALTVSGTFCSIAEEVEKKQILEKIAERHPHLQALLAQEEAEPVAIKIHSFLLLEGALDAQFIER